MYVLDRPWATSGALALWAVLWSAPVSADAGANDAEAIVYTVQHGDTLSAIAARHQLSLETLLDRNPTLEADRIREGQSIVIDDNKRRVSYVVQGGDTLSAIARRFDVSTDDVLRWNKGLDRDRIREGQKLSIWSDRPRSESQSVGSPNDGKLVRARRLPRHPGIAVRERARAFGTDETINALLRAVESVRSAHPRTPRLCVHDLSLKQGGPIDDHRSHQSGRDADLAYFHKLCPNGACDFRRLTGDDLDVERTWRLLHYWLERDLLEAVFIDYRLQAPLYRYARAQGASAHELRRWFQYPYGRTYPLGVIRHFPKHDDHMHVRFACHHSDPECKTFRPLLTGQAHASRE